MARPIRARPAPSGASLGTLNDALGPELGASVEPLRELLSLVRLLGERGILRFSADLLREEDRVIEVVSERFRPEELRRAVANLEVVVRAFRDLDPDALGRFARGVPPGLLEAQRSEASAPLGVFEMLSVLQEPDVNRGVRMVLGFLRGVGRSADG